MLFWIAAAVVSCAVVVLIARPLVHAPSERGAEMDSTAADVAVYRDQLKEIDVDQARGLLRPQEANAARVEVQRRLLAAADAAPNGNAGAAGPTPDRVVSQEAVDPHRWLIVGGAAVAPVLAVGLYLAVGSPGTPDFPRSARLKVPVDQLPVAEMVARVEARLREQPGDGRGWDILAPIYLRQGRFADARSAYGQAIRLLGGSNARLFGLANADVGVNQGAVSDQALAIFERLVGANPKMVQAQFWLGAGYEQRERQADARKAYEAVRANTPATSELHRAVVQRLASLPAVGPPVSAKIPAPSQQAAAEIRKLGAREQRDRIEGMVAQLDGRLRENGADPDGWLRLIRSYSVLGKKAEASDALARARQALSGNKDALAKLDQLAGALALGNAKTGG